MKNYEDLQPHQQLVVEEAKLVFSNVEKLHAFIQESPIFETLPTNEQELLVLQISAMTLYMDVLLRRVELF